MSTSDLSGLAEISKPAIYSATEEKQDDQIAIETAINDKVATEVTLAALAAEDFATETTLTTVATNTAAIGGYLYPTGTGTNGTVTLTLANTAYPVPAATPTGKYTITLQNKTAILIYIGYANSNADGLNLEAGESVTVDLGANQSMHAYCGTAGTIINYTMKLVA